MKSVALVIESCQGTSAPSAPDGVFRMIKLLHELKEDEPLRLHDPSHFFKLPDPKASSEVETAAGGGTTPRAERAKKAHEDLTDVAQTTREKLRQAILARFTGVRYNGEKYKTASHLFDMISALNPFMRQLPHIRSLSPNAEVATAVKQLVWDHLTALATHAVQNLRKSGESVAPAKPTAKRMKFTAPADSDDDCMFFDEGAEDMDDEDETAERSPESLANEAIQEYKNFQVFFSVLPRCLRLGSFT